MNTINHHLTDAIMMAYSAGSLPEAFELVIATHISLCDECRSRMHEFDAIGGSVMEQSDVAELDEGSFESTMARITNGDWSVDEPAIRAPKVSFRNRSATTSAGTWTA